MQTDTGGGQQPGRRALRQARRRRWVAWSLLVVLTVVVGGCVSAGGAADDPGEPPQEPRTPDDLATKPDMAAVLTADRGDPPTELRVEDLVEGDGSVARPGDEVTVHYVGAAWSTGVEFDATWDRDQPDTFTLGSGESIPGWEQGLAGMRVGGRRVLIIPPELAYGDRGSGSDIAPGETIVFVIDLLEVA